MIACKPTSELRPQCLLTNAEFIVLQMFIVEKFHDIFEWNPHSYILILSFFT